MSTCLIIGVSIVALVSILVVLNIAVQASIEVDSSIPMAGEVWKVKGVGLVTITASNAHDGRRSRLVNPKGEILNIKWRTGELVFYHEGCYHVWTISEFLKVSTLHNPTQDSDTEVADEE